MSQTRRRNPKDVESDQEEDIGNDEDDETEEGYQSTDDDKPSSVPVAAPVSEGELIDTLDTDPRGRKAVIKLEKEVQRDPTIVPRVGVFFLHDERASGNSGSLAKKRPGNRNRQAEASVWLHDKFEEIAIEAPRSQRKPSQSNQTKFTKSPDKAKQVQSSQRSKSHAVAEQVASVSESQTGDHGDSVPSSPVIDHDDSRIRIKPTKPRGNNSERAKIHKKISISGTASTVVTEAPQTELAAASPINIDVEVPLTSETENSTSVSSFSPAPSLRAKAREFLPSSSSRAELRSTDMTSPLGISRVGMTNEPSVVADLSNNFEYQTAVNTRMSMPLMMPMQMPMMGTSMELPYGDHLPMPGQYMAPYPYMPYGYADPMAFPNSLPSTGNVVDHPAWYPPNPYPWYGSTPQHPVGNPDGSGSLDANAKSFNPYSSSYQQQY